MPPGCALRNRGHVRNKTVDGTAIETHESDCHAYFISIHGGILGKIGALETKTRFYCSGEQNLSQMPASKSHSREQVSVETVLQVTAAVHGSSIA